ncbi:ImmA/IrrE family metallo-endopeptidase, partial [Gordonia sp. i37]|uniref:ImmA/IrrE family metallo-endopeptidase n=1 Tax=Gordonia sp. i37 TaxID=1961707 RepID=UPI0009AD9A5F
PAGARRRADRAAAALVERVGSCEGEPTLGDLLTAARALTGCETRLVPADFGSTRLFGMVVRLPVADVVMFDRYAPPTHQLFTILHEVGHLLLEHALMDGTAEPAESGCGGSIADERAAEYFAARVSHLLRVRSARMANPDSSAARIADTLTGGTP